MSKIISYYLYFHKVYLSQNKTQDKKEEKRRVAKFISPRWGIKSNDGIRKSVHTSRKCTISAMLSWQIKSSVISTRPQNSAHNIFKNMYLSFFSFAYSSLNIFSAPVSQALKILCIRTAFVISSCFFHSSKKGTWMSGTRKVGGGNGWGRNGWLLSGRKFDGWLIKVS